MEKYLRMLGIGEGSFKWVLIYNEDGIDKKDKPIDELYTDSYADKPLMNLAKKVFFIDRDTREIKQIK